MIGTFYILNYILMFLRYRLRVLNLFGEVNNLLN